MKTTVTQWATKAAGAGAIALLLTTPAFAQSRGSWNRNNNTNSNRNGQASTQRSNANRQPANTAPATTQRGNQAYTNAQASPQRANRNQTYNNGQASPQRANGNQTYNTNTQGTYQRAAANRSNGNTAYRENQRINASGKVSSFNRERDGYRVQLDRGQSFWVPQSSFGNRARDLRVGVSINLGGIFRGGSIYADAVSWPNEYGQYDGAYANGFVRGVVERVDYRTGTVWLQDDASGRVIAADVNGRSLRTLRPGEYVELSGQWISGGVFDVASINIR
jgi:hypothetical protein